MDGSRAIPAQRTHEHLTDHFEIPLDLETERVRLFWSFTQALCRYECGLLTERQFLFYAERWRDGNGWKDRKLPRGDQRVATRDAFGRIAYADRRDADPGED